MLRKLIKYDLLWVNRVIIVYAAIVIILSILTGISNNFTETAMASLLHHILPGVTIAAFVNIIINAAIRIWVRFRQNCYQDESYLTHTLPVSKAQIYDSKIISSLISTLFAVIVVIAGFFIAFWTNDMYEYFRELVENSDVAFTICGVLITTILEIIYITQVGLFGIVVGHRQNNNRVLYSVVVGILLYFTLNAVLLGAIYFAGFFDDSLKAMFSSSPDNAIGFENYRSLIIWADSLYLVVITSLYFAGKKLFAKGVNVE